MKRIAIFCDGTWNSPDIDQPTHVFRLSDAMKVDAQQRMIYVPGVGTDGAAGWLARIGAGAFGWGLADNIKRAYRALAMQYQPGDQVMIFGFSRGAYTARSLAGMIRKCGIIERPTRARVDDAFELYRLPGAANHPDALKILKARRAMSPLVATSQDDLNFRAAYPVEGRVDASHLMQIAYLGVWDTVGSLGVPAPLFGPVANLWNSRYRFHDTVLTSMVKGARHAVGLDERRVFYKPSLWDNLEQTRDDPGLNAGDRSPDRPYQQVWFVGTHSIVGGSSGTRALTGFPLDWVAKGAVAEGLVLRETPPLMDVTPDAGVDSAELQRPPFLYRVAGALLRWRAGPGHPIDLHPSADARVRQRRDYRPKSLRNLMPQLFGPEPAPHRPPGGGER